MAKIKEISNRDIKSWLSSDLGQTMPQFTTAGTAGYGTTQKPYFIVQGASRINLNQINRQSDDYRENVRALSGIGRVTGLSYVGTYNGMAGVDGVLDDTMAKIKEKSKKAWGAVADTAGAVYDKAATKLKSVTDYVKDPTKFANDLIAYTPGALAVTQAIIADLKVSQTNLWSLYNDRMALEKALKEGKKISVTKQQLKDWETGSWKTSSDYYQIAYIMYALPATRQQAIAAGVAKPDINQSWVLKPVSEGTISGAVYRKVKESNGTGQLSGLDGLGVLPAIAIAAIIVGILATAATVCYVTRELSARGVAEARAAAAASIANSVQQAGGTPQEINDALKEVGEQAIKTDKARQEREKGGLLDIGSWLPWAVGGVLAVAFLPTLLELGKTGASAVKARRDFAPQPSFAPVSGLRRRRYR